MDCESQLVLLVEDNEDHAELLLSALAAYGAPHTVVHVSDGEAALDYLFHRGAYATRAIPRLPNLVLLDLRLPKIDGLEVLRQVKADRRLRAVPVVVLSSSNAEGDVTRAYQHHVNSYVVKPFGFEQLGTLMDHLGQYWLGWNRSQTEPCGAETGQ